MCACVHTRVYMCIYACKREYVAPKEHDLLCVCMYICVYTSVYVCIYVCVCVCLCENVCTYSCIYECACVYVFVHECVCERERACVCMITLRSSRQHNSFMCDMTHSCVT